uniref:RING-type E3 ubiquitin transferase n=1 Tax=Clastoptera arizonana TaxID=38151 RepID=A0A1B6CDM4_9HEMI
MADEAAVGNAIARFFCHKCNVEINRVQVDYTCPTCQSGFIEVLDSQQQDPSEESDSDMEVVQPFEMLNDMLMGLSGGLEDRRGDRSWRRRDRRRVAQRGRQVVPFETLIQDFIVNLTEVGLGGIGVAPRSNGQVTFLANISNLVDLNLDFNSIESLSHYLFDIFSSLMYGNRLFLGNPGDYAWGREGLDAIVTTLLNQMDGTGPPPLAKDKIQEIPVTIITQEQVDTNLQCSVCWEDFKVSEPVRKLPCEHVYHEPCIIPWLELHGTCPICRKTLSDEAGAEENNQAPLFGASGSVGTNTLAALFRAANDATSRASSTSSSDSSSTSSSNNTSYSDNNMDLEYD